MRCIALETELQTIDPVAQKDVLREEAEVVWSLMMSGQLRESYFKQGTYEAVLIFESESVECVQNLLQKLPLVREGFISFEVIGLDPYPGLSRLFVTG